MSLELSNLDRWYLKAIEPTWSRFTRHVHIGSSSPPGTSFYTVDTEKYPHMLPLNMAKARMFSTALGFPVTLIQEGLNKINNPLQVQAFVDKHPVETIAAITLAGLMGYDFTKNGLKKLRNNLEEKES